MANFISKAKRTQILGLLRQGLTVRDVSRRTGAHANTVRRYCGMAWDKWVDGDGPKIPMWVPAMYGGATSMRKQFPACPQCGAKAEKYEYTTKGGSTPWRHSVSYECGAAYRRDRKDNEHSSPRKVRGCSRRDSVSEESNAS